MNRDFARKLIEYPGEFVTKQLFARNIDGVFWVDWREADDEIVRMVAKAIGNIDLTAAWVDGKFVITCQGRKTVVPLTPKAGEQGVTMETLNKALAPHYEIRFVRASDGNDTLAFMPLRKDHWAAFQGIYGPKLEAAFAQISRNYPFGGDDAVTLTPEQKKQMNAQMKGVKFARANFRIWTTKFLARIRSNPEMQGGAMPVIEPVFGDLVLTYYHDLRPTYPLVTVGQLEEYSMTRDELRTRAYQNAIPRGWKEMKVTPRGKILEVTAPNGMAACLAVRDKFWDEMETIDGPITAAFPRGELVLYAPTKDLAAVAELRNVINAMDFSQDDALSPNLYDRVKQVWSMR